MADLASLLDKWKELAMTIERRYVPLGKFKPLEDRVAALEGNTSTSSPPVWTSTPSVSLTLGQLSSYDLRQHVSDPDSSTLTFDLGGSVALPDGLILSSDGIISGTPTAAGTTADIIVEAFDGDTAVPATFNITINDSPVWLSTPDPNFTNGVAATYDLSTLVEGSAPITISLNTGGGVNNVTNECLHNEDFSNSAWVKSAGSITSDSTTGNFDGGIGEDYDKLTADSAGGASQVYARQLVTLTASTQYVFGVHAKADVLNWISLQIQTFSGATPSGGSQYFNLSTGVAGADAGYQNYGIRSLGGGEYFVFVVFTVGSSDVTGWCTINLADSDGDNVVGRDGLNSLLIGGAQIYEGSDDNGSYVGPVTTAPVTENIGGGGGGASLPSGVTYSGTVLTYDGAGAVANETGIIATATDTNSNVKDSASFDVDIATAPSTGGAPIFGRNGWFMTGGYMISNSNIQLVQEPYLTWNAEKDILIPQNFGYFSTPVNTATGRFKAIKAINPDIKILPYLSPSEVNKVSNGISQGSYNKELIEGSDGHTSWYLRDTSGNQVEALFSANSLRASYTIQFNTNNSSGQNYGEALADKVNTQVNAQFSNGKQIDYIDGFYWDVVPPAPQKIFVVGSSSPRVQALDDFDQDTVQDGRADETDGLGVEANYGGCRMMRRGAIDFKEAWEAEFGTTVQGLDLVVWRNGTREGIDYSTAGVLKNADARDTSEFYQAWGGSIFEDVQNSLAFDPKDDPTGSQYVYQGWNGFEQTCRHAARIKAMTVPTASHPWGKFGEHALLMEYRAHRFYTTPRQEDLEHLRYGEFVARLCGAMSGVTCGKLYPSPMLDESVPYVGDTHDGVAPSMGTLSNSTPNGGTNADFTLRSPDYENGSADFYWEMYEDDDGKRWLWVGRTDAGTLTTGDLQGSGSAVTCNLPDYGAGNSGWKHFDATDNTYVNPYTGLQYRNQSPNINNGTVLTGGTYGQIDLVPFTARLLESY